MTEKQFEKIWRDFLPEHIEERYPKGDKDRGLVIVAIALFMLMLQRRIFKDKNKKK